MVENTPIQIPFAMGVDRKTDPWQIRLGNFFTLNNSIFTKAGRLTKRAGFQELTTLSNTPSSLSTFNGGLVAIGNQLNAFSDSTQTWTSKGTYLPLNLSAETLVRSAANQTQCDVATSSNGLTCVVYTETAAGTSSYKYSIFDMDGACLVNPTAITPTSGAVTGSARVFALGRYFMIVFTATITAADHLQYIAVPISNPATPGSAVNITSTYTSASTVAWDGVVANENLYIAWNSSGSAGIKMLYITSTLTIVSAVTPDASHQATMMSVTADNTVSPPVIWVSYYNSGTSTGYTFARNSQLNAVLAATQIISTGTILNITSSAQNGVNQIFWEVSNTYSWGSIPSNFIEENTVTQAGVVGTPLNLLRGVGLASKSWIINGTVYVLGAFSSPNQKTYFLIQQTSAAASPTGKTVGKLAYSNGGGYLTLGLPSAVVSSSEVTIGYLYADLLVPTNTAQAAPNTGAAVFAQTGVNAATFNFTATPTTAEIGGALHISGAQLWMYDGTQIVEHGFHVWPDNINVTTATGAGSITAADYYYQALYEWTDASGMIHRSAPSLPVLITTTTATSTNTIKVPTLRETLKTNVKIILYRWTALQPVYYQVTSLTSPTLNSTTADSVTITDTLASSAIIGNSIIYTTGGVVENIGAPATNILQLYNGRFFLVDAEDPNLLWFSKQVIEGTPVEMSDLFTLFVSPTLGAQGNTGPMSALGAMDDKLIIFKPNAAIYYITGTGPDNTGASNDFSQPVFVASTVGCSNTNSVLLMPLGLMFQSDKGIWLLERNLATNYIGAQVEDFNGQRVLSALTIPGTNQVRFEMSSGTKLMYDYYFSQWGTFTGVNAASSTLFEDLHTTLDVYGRIFQEQAGSYLDGTVPVLMNFTTSWVNVAGLQGFERVKFFYLLGQYITPHTLNVSIAYDYNDSASQSTLITPDNYAGPYGSDPLYGNADYFGGQSNVEQWRVFLDKQKCQAFQISVQENFDSSFGTVPGAGLTLSGINLIVGVKKGYPTLKPSRSVG